MTATPNGPRAVRGTAVRAEGFTGPCIRYEGASLPDLPTLGTPFVCLPDTDADRERRELAVAKAIYQCEFGADKAWPVKPDTTGAALAYRALARAALAAMAGDV